MDIPEPFPSLYPTRLLPSTDAWRLEFTSDGEEDDIFGIYAEIATQVDGTIHGDIIVLTV